MIQFEGMEITPLMGGSGYLGPIEFRADHPFVFYLVDRDNDNIAIFMGRVSNPLVAQGVDVAKPTQTEPHLELNIQTNNNSFRTPSKNNRPNVNPNLALNPDQIIFPLSEPYPVNRNSLRRTSTSAVASAPNPVLFPDEEGHNLVNSFFF